MGLQIKVCRESPVALPEKEAGADIDENLVTKVYRAARTIKREAGFMGLTTIKSLTHEMKNTRSDAPQHLY